jgi:hypothetical protein
MASIFAEHHSKDLTELEKEEVPNLLAVHVFQSAKQGQE